MISSRAICTESCFSKRRPRALTVAHLGNTPLYTLSTGHITETHMHSIAMTCSSAICTDFNTLSSGCITETHMHLNATITSSAVHTNSCTCDRNCTRYTRLNNSTSMATQIIHTRYHATDSGTDYFCCFFWQKTTKCCGVVLFLFLINCEQHKK